MLPAVFAVVVALVLAVILGAMAFLVVGLLFRGRGGGGPDRGEALAELGYAPAGPSSWSRKIQGNPLVFEEQPDKLRWTARLPRYNTMTLELVEASTGKVLDGAFQADQAELDERFLLGSPLRAQIVPLLRQPKLRRALLGMPNLALQLSADELILEDPGRVGLSKLGGGLQAELELHQRVATVVITLFSVLYTETGTVFDEYR